MYQPGPPSGGSGPENASDDLEIQKLKEGLLPEGPMDEDKFRILNERSYDANSKKFELGIQPQEFEFDLNQHDKTLLEKLEV